MLTIYQMPVQREKKNQLLQYLLVQKCRYMTWADTELQCVSDQELYSPVKELTYTQRERGWRAGQPDTIEDMNTVDTTTLAQIWHRMTINVVRPSLVFVPLTMWGFFPVTKKVLFLQQTKMLLPNSTQWFSTSCSELCGHNNFGTDLKQNDSQCT